MNLIALFIGGGLGAIVRYYIATLSFSIFGFPISTLLANALASLLLGYLFIKLEQDNIWYFIGGIGFCGAVSTFSTFSLENYRFIKEQAFLMLFLNIAINVLICLIGIYLGTKLVKE